MYLCTMKKSTAIIIVCLFAAILFLPWLGSGYFQTKGEPREAIVAVNMLQEGNWVLPVSYGTDIPYKPPFLAWLIAFFSLIFNGGAVSEFTSRLPSVIAATGLFAATWRIVAGHAGQRKAWVTTIVMMTSFEVFRAATACRVDMILTCCMTGALYAMYSMRGHPWRYVWAAVLMSGAVLTKGPVGALLPCLAMGIYMLLRGDNFFRTTAVLVALCAASFIIPALWYYAAYQQGGDEFLRLALEENVGRLTGTMSYGSHLNPWWYNPEMIVAGMLPWTVPVLIALCYSRIRSTVKGLRVNKQLPLFAWTVALTVLIFYCIPASKRGVYLLPCYPFLAYGAAWVLCNVSQTKLIRVWNIFLAGISIIAPIAFIALTVLQLPKIPIDKPQWWQWFFAVLPLIGGVWWLTTRKISLTGLKSSLAMTYILLLAYNAAYTPAFLNPRSDIQAAQIIRQKVPGDAPIVTYLPQDNLLRYYSINYYLGDRLRRVATRDQIPAGAWLLTNPGDGFDGDTISMRSADTRKPIILVAPKTVIKTHK